MTSYDDQVAASQYAQYAADPSPAPTNGVTAQTPVEESAASSEAQPQQSDLERYWDIVKSNPDDFTSWEYLIRVAETAEGGLTAQSPQENITNMRNVFDQFLAKFPLCFGYWKKYADFEFNVQGPVEAEKIYERSVAAIANSVDLWTQYCAFKIEHYPDNVEEIRGLFERGASCVGLDFLSHLFWDKYIEFEKSRQAYDKVLKILERIIRIPMHQYARFFDDFTNLCGTRPINELISPEQHQQFEEEARAAPPAPPAEGAEGEQLPSTEKTEEQIQNEIRTRIYNLNVDVYMKTQAETNKRWIFEQEIKRPYFHVKAMDDVQLINWRRYLDFEESEGEEMRVQVLYERCLVACALYEEFWLRYARWMVSKDRISDARSIYERAINVFIPMSRPNIRTSYACFEEQQGNIEDARLIYKTILNSMPGHVETIVKYAHFERRRQPSNLDFPIEIITSAQQNPELDDKSKAFLSVQHAKILWHNKGLVEEARKIFQQGSHKYLESKYFWLNYFNFELSQPDPVAETNLREIYDLIRNTAILPPESIRDFSYRYLDFLMERGLTIASYNKIDVESNGPVAIRVALDTKKRGSEDDPEKPAKQVRMDGVVDSASIAGTPVVAATPYAAPGGAQPPYYPQGQWGTPGYTAYPTTNTAQQTPYPYPYQYPQTAASTAANPAQTPATTWDYTQQSATGY
ncbi:16173_t:CDS:10 [Acaulospora morrowiae]|uniref:16173_t:CDS:1 n=1 Tax=Acaulospora morrowiae TaxID=94023 RepID=A0A9N8ZKC4_9GLOM|nr:16173_t:CDS:10 [Acaulospora morrowiae]